MLQNSSFNYLIIRIIIIIALKVTFLCIIIKLITALSCVDVDRSYLSLNAFYLLFHALLWGTTYSFMWPHNEHRLDAYIMSTSLSTTKQLQGYTIIPKKQTLSTSIVDDILFEPKSCKHTVVIDPLVTRHSTISIHSLLLLFHCILSLTLHVVTM